MTYPTLSNTGPDEVRSPGSSGTELSPSSVVGPVKRTGRGVLWRITLREILGRPGRALFTLAGIIVAVTAVVAVRITAITMEQSYHQMYESLTGRTDLEIIVEGGGMFPQSVVDRLVGPSRATVLEGSTPSTFVAENGPAHGIPGIRVASPIYQQPTNLFVADRHDPVPVLLFGVEPIDYQVRAYSLGTETPIEQASGMLLEDVYARNFGLNRGDTVTLFTRAGLQEVEVGDTVRLGTDAKSAAQIGLAVLPLEAVQYWFRKPGQINQIDLILNSDIDPYEKMAEIAAVLPAECTVRIPPIRLQMSRSTIASAEQGLRFAYAISLMLAAVMILNTFMMNVSERRRQVAVLRALGTTRGQIVTMFLREGLLLGIAGSVIGCVVGAMAAKSLTGAMGGLYHVDMPQLHITWEPFIVALICGPGLAILSAYIPARLAGSVTPVEGMRPAIQEEDSPLPRKTVFVGACGLILTTFGLAGCILELLPADLAIPVGCGFILSLIMTIPVLLTPLLRFFGRIMRWIFGIESRVAERMVGRRRTRTTLTIGVLYIAIGGSVALGTAILNNVDEVQQWQATAYSGDYFIHATDLNRIGDRMVTLPDPVVKAVSAVPGIATVQRLGFRSDAMVAERQMHVIYEEVLPERSLPFMLRTGDEASVREGLASGGVVIGETVSHRLKVDIGDTVPIRCRDGVYDAKIVGMATDFVAGGMTVHCSWATGCRLFDAEDPGFLAVVTEPSQRDTVGTELQRICDANGLMLTSFAVMQQQLSSVVTGIVAGLWAVIALSFVVAAFGVTNTLTMNVLEQTRDLALLRVIAMTRDQVRRTVLAQAAMLGAIGIGLGLCGGLLGAYTTNLCLPAVLGYSVHFRLDPMLMLGTAVGGFIVTLIAAWFPAARASRLNLLIALHYE